MLCRRNTETGTGVRSIKHHEKAKPFEGDRAFMSSTPSKPTTGYSTSPTTTCSFRNGSNHKVNSLEGLSKCWHAAFMESAAKNQSVPAVRGRGLIGATCRNTRASCSCSSQSQNDFPVEKRLCAAVRDGGGGSRLSNEMVSAAIKVT